MEIVIILTVLAFVWVKGLQGLGKATGNVISGIVGMFKKK